MSVFIDENGRIHGLSNKQAKATGQLGWNFANEYSYYSTTLNDKMKELYERYGSTDYWNQIASNPYLNLPGPAPERANDYWRDYMRQYEQHAMEEINKIESIIREEKYNSPLSQVERERQAGLNPDLNGQVSSGSATEATELPSPEMPTLSDWKLNQFQKGMQFFDAGNSFINMVFGVAQNLQGLRNGNLQNMSLEMDNFMKGNRFAPEFLASRMPVPNEGDDPQVYFNNMVRAYPEMLKLTGLSKKTRKALDSAFRSIPPDSVNVLGDYFGKLSGFVGNKWSSAQGMTKFGWSDDFDKMLSNVADAYSKISFDIWSSQQNLTNSIIKFQSDYYNSLNDNQAGNTQGFVESQNLNNEAQYVSELGAFGVPGKRAQSESRSLDIKKMQDEIVKWQTERVHEMEKEIDSLYDKYLRGDDFLSRAGRIAVPILKQFLTQNIMSYSQSALESLSRMQFSHHPVAPFTYDYSNRNTSIFNSPIAQ